MSISKYLLIISMNGLGDTSCAIPSPDCLLVETPACLLDCIQFPCSCLPTSLCTHGLPCLAG